MEKLPISMSCGAYDRMEALRSGAVQVEGVALAVQEAHIPHCDIQEMELSHYLAAKAQSAPLIGIPVFPLRRFDRESWQRDRIFPILTTLVMSERLHAEQPWLAESLFKACEEAKRWCIRQMRFSGALRYMLPWLLDEIDAMDALFGADPWPYGVEANRKTLEEAVRLLRAHGKIACEIDIDEMFTPIVAWAE